MKKIFTYAGKNMKYMYGAIVCLLASTIFGIIPFYLLNNIIISILQDTFNLELAITMVLYIGIAFTLKGALFGAGLGLSHIGAFNTIYNIRKTFTDKMAKHPMGEIMKEGTGKYKKTFVEDISSLESSLAHLFPEGIPYIAGVVITIIAIFVIDWRLGLAVVIMIPISASPMAYMMKIGLEKMPKFYEARDVLNHSLVEYVSGMEVIKIFNKTNDSYKGLYDSVIKARDFSLDWCKVSWKTMSVLYSLLPCTLLVPLPLGIYFMMNGSLKIEELTLVSMLALSIGEPLIKVINYIPSIPMIDYAVKKIEAIFVKDEVKSGTYDKMSDNFDVEFKNVTFAYGETDVINNLNLSVRQNSMCAIVGPSGSGKSTLVKLLMHFWDIKSGSITIGGRDITEFTFENLMDHMSYVSQENTLFEGTILDNIKVAKDNLSKEEIIEACKKANVHDFIESLEHGYESDVGALGGKLSGGERQRITIARAIIKNAPIVILDEATAFADAENEFLIQEALSKLLAGKTVIIIAHKLHTITQTNQIALINKGNLEIVGKHDELLQKSELYKKLWEQNEKSINWNIGGTKNA